MPSIHIFKVHLKKPNFLTTVNNVGRKTLFNPVFINFYNWAKIRSYLTGRKSGHHNSVFVLCKIVNVSVRVISLAFGPTDNSYVDIDNSAYHKTSSNNCLVSFILRYDNLVIMFGKENYKTTRDLETK